MSISLRGAFKNKVDSSLPCSFQLDNPFLISSSANKEVSLVSIIANLDIVNTSYDFILSSIPWLLAILFNFDTKNSHFYI